MEFDFQPFLVNILPIIVTVGAVGYKVYYDVHNLKHDLSKGFSTIGTKLDAMEKSINKINLDLLKNEVADQYRDKELSRLSKEIEKLQK